MIVTLPKQVFMYKELITAKRQYILNNAMLFCKDKSDAEDLTQDVLINAYRHQDKFDGANLEAWLYTMTKNLFINRYRKTKKTTIIEFNADHVTGIDTNTGEFACLRDYTDNVISKLPQAMQDVLNLRLKGYDYEETARLMNIPTGTVRSLLFRARSILADKFPGYKIKPRKKYR